MATKSNPIDKLIREIIAGRHDERIAAIIMACADRAAPAGLSWGVRWGDHEVTEDNLTVGQAEEIERRTGESFANIDPTRSITMGAAVLYVLLVHHAGMTAEQAEQEVSNASAKKLANAVFLHQPEPPPFDSEQPSS